jgi:hypothetical protein
VDAFAGTARGSRILLGVLLLFLAAYRLLLIQSGGQLYWPDEYRYIHALHLLDELRRGDLISALGWVFGEVATMGGVAAAPTYVVMSSIPAAFQGIAAVFLGVQPDSRWFYWIPGVANVIVSLTIALILYRIAWRLTSDRGFALTSTFVYGLLANTNVYVRHLFSYDLALLLFLTALVVLIENRAAPRLTLRDRSTVAGILAGTAMTTYPGYNPFVVILLVVILANHWGEWKRVAMFFGGIASVFCVWEVVARAGGFSFIGSLRQFSRLYTPGNMQGSAAESYSLLARYMWNVEGAVGVVLLALFACFLGMAILGKFGRSETAPIGAASVTFLAFATFAVVSSGVVFYGRLLHMYLPFLVLGSIVAIKHWTFPSARGTAVAVLGVASLVSFVPTAVSAFAIRFPKDVERELRVSFPGDPTICDILTLERMKWLSPSAGYAATTDGDAPLKPCDVIAENVRHLYPLPSALSSAPPPGFELVSAYKHPLQFTPYWFEGFDPDERARLRADRPVIRIYARERSR